MQKKIIEKYEIYVGLKDRETLEEISIERVTEIIAEVFMDEGIGFSVLLQKGGYTHSKGYTIETSIRVTLFDLPQADVERIAMKLKAAVNTDAVMITREECEYYYK